MYRFSACGALDDLGWISIGNGTMHHLSSDSYHAATTPSPCIVNFQFTVVQSSRTSFCTIFMFMHAEIIVSLRFLPKIDQCSATRTTVDCPVLNHLPGLYRVQCSTYGEQNSVLSICRYLHTYRACQKSALICPQLHAAPSPLLPQL